MNIDQINDEWEQDSSIDRNKLTEESLKTPNLHAKYLKILMAHKVKLMSKIHAFNELKLAKFRYYRGEMSKEDLTEHGWLQWQGPRPLKGDMEQFLEGDKDMTKEKVRIQYLENCIYQLESILMQIKARDWQIKNAIENSKFIAGQ